MTPDLINGGFELVGAVLTAGSVVHTFRAKGYAGVYWPAVLFFFAWGVWNVYFYSFLQQWWSLAGGVCLAATNGAWLGLMWYYGPIGSGERASR